MCENAAKQATSTRGKKEEDGEKPRNDKLCHM